MRDLAGGARDPGPGIFRDPESYNIGHKTPRQWQGFLAPINLPDDHKPPSAPSAAPPASQPTRLRRRLLVAWIATISLLGMYWLQLYFTHQGQLAEAEAHTRLRSAQLAHALALQTRTLFTKIDYLTRHLGEHWLDEGARGLREATNVAQQSLSNDAVAQVAVADSQGQVVFSSLVADGDDTSTYNGPPVSIADREHFRVHLQGARPALFVSAPVLGRVSGQWTVQFSRPLLKDGDLRGVIVISVSTRHLSEALQDLFPDPANVAMLLNERWMYLARSERTEQVMGQMASHHTRQQAGQHGDHGSFTAVTGMDGVERYYSWRRVAGYPVLVSVGLGRDAALATVSAALHDSRWQSLIGSALLLLALGLISRLWLRQARQAQALTDAGERLTKLVSLVPGTVYQQLLRPDGSSCLPYASPGIQDIYALDPADVAESDEAILARIHPADRERVAASIRDSATRLSLWRCEYRVVHPDGNLRWVLGQARPERTANGDTLWYGYIHDVTTEHETADILRRSEAHLRQTLEAVRNGLWSWNVATGELQSDGRINEILDRAPEDRTRHYDDFVAALHPLDRERVLGNLCTALNQHPHDIISSQFRLRTATERWVWVEVRGRVVDWDEHGLPLRLLGTCSDISAQVAETQLRNVLLDQSMAAIMVLSADRRIMEANKHAQEIFTTPGETLRNQSIHGLHVNDEHYQRLGSHYENLRRNGQLRLEFPLRDAHGHTRWFDMQAVLRDPDDEHSDVVWTLVDISDKHRIEAALAAEHQRLTTLLQRFPGGVLMEDAAGTVTTTNPGLRELLGLPDLPDSLIGLRHDMLCERLGPERAAWLHEPDHDEPGEKRRTIEVLRSDGRTLEIDWLPIERDGERLGRVWLLHDISDHKQREQILATLAATDALTGLPNRRSFMNSLDAALVEHHKHPERSSAILMLDLDHFKKINDGYGHTVGDLVLQHVAQIVRHGLRQRDAAGRLGGEEFAVLLRGIDQPDALALANRLRSTLENTPIHTDQGTVWVTMSIGLAMLGSDDATRSLARADEALYAAKAAGRNRVCCWEP